MGTPLRIVPEPKRTVSSTDPQRDGKTLSNWWDATPGDMWPCPSAMGSHTFEGRSPCWIIRLPGTSWVWHTNEKAGGDGQFWDVSGEPPSITVRPSIQVNTPNGWHGFITNGELVSC